MLRLLFLCTFELLFDISFMFAIRYCFHLYNFISYFSTCLFFHSKMKLFFFFIQSIHVVTSRTFWNEPCGENVIST